MVTPSYRPIQYFGEKSNKTYNSCGFDFLKRYQLSSKDCMRRLNGIQEVGGSIPPGSTKFPKTETDTHLNSGQACKHYGLQTKSRRGNPAALFLGWADTTRSGTGP